MQHQDPLPQLLSRAADRFLDIITDHGNHTAEVYQDYGSQIISWAADFISLNSVDSIEKERSQDYGSQIISWAADFIDLNSVPATEEERSDAYQHYVSHVISWVADFIGLNSVPGTEEERSEDSGSANLSEARFLLASGVSFVSRHSIHFCVDIRISIIKKKINIKYIYISVCVCVS